MDPAMLPFNSTWLATEDLNIPTFVRKYEKIDGKIIEPNVLRDFPGRQVKLLEVLPEIVDMSKVGVSCRVRNPLTTYQKMSTSWGRFAHIPGIWVSNSNLYSSYSICWLRPGLPKLQYHQYPSFTDNSTIFLWRAIFFRPMPLFRPNRVVL